VPITVYGIQVLSQRRRYRVSSSAVYSLSSIRNVSPGPMNGALTRAL